MANAVIGKYIFQRLFALPKFLAIFGLAATYTVHASAMQA